MANSPKPQKQAQPLMPHATATWLVETTGLTFAQIAAFCQIHVLEVQAIADETASTKLTPRDPVRAGELSDGRDREGPEGSVLPAEDLRRARADPPHLRPALHAARQAAGQARRHRLGHPQPPEITDGQISKLIGTTKTTIAAIRNREHWNIANITPKDPVTLGLCSQRELDALVAAAAKKAGVVPQEDGRLGADRDAMIAELRAERDALTSDAEAEETPREHTAETLFRSNPA
jgi:uncharacterized protein